MGACRQERLTQQVTLGGRRIQLLIFMGAAAVGCAVVAVHQCAREPRDHRAAPSDISIPGTLRFVLKSNESKIQLHGETTLGAWDSASDDIRASALLQTNLAALDAIFDQVEKRVQPTLPPFPVQSVAPSSVQLAVAVTSFRGANSGMDRDMQAALKANDHPDITYAVDAVQSARLTINPKNGQPAIQVVVLGSLTVAGLRRSTTTSAIISQDSRGHFIVRAEQALLMSDFNVIPPTALFGLIHAHNSMSVVFDLDFAPNRTTGATKGNVTEKDQQ